MKWHDGLASLVLTCVWNWIGSNTSHVGDCYGWNIDMNSYNLRINLKGEITWNWWAVKLMCFISKQFTSNTQLDTCLINLRWKIQVADGIPFGRRFVTATWNGWNNRRFFSELIILTFVWGTHMQIRHGYGLNKLTVAAAFVCQVPTPRKSTLKNVDSHIVWMKR